MSNYSDHILAFMTTASKSLSPRKRPRQTRAVATVEAILEAAAHILEAGGLAAFNTNAIAEKAGVSIGSLYQYFPTKEAILARMIRLRRQRLLDDVRAGQIGQIHVAPLERDRHAESRPRFLLVAHSGRVRRRQVIRLDVDRILSILIKKTFSIYMCPKG